MVRVSAVKLEKGASAPFIVGLSKVVFFVNKVVIFCEQCVVSQFV